MLHHFKDLYLVIFMVFLPFQGFASECLWRDGQRSGVPTIEVVSGECLISDLARSDFILDLKLSVTGSIKVTDSFTLISANIFVHPTATLLIDGSDTPKVGLVSSPSYNANIIVEGGTLKISGSSIISHDPSTGKPDTDLDDGRSFVRVDSFVNSEGISQNGHVEIDNSKLSYLGYNSIGSGEFSAYGFSLKVRKENELKLAKVTGWIKNSELSYNYRGYYSYGARGILFEGNFVHNNIDYGVDPHDDSTGFIARNNLIENNGGTGLALSRRCENSIVENNIVRGNGNNGILIHDLSNSVIVRGNTITENKLDGVVVHDSHNVQILNNKIYGNRNGIRIFAGSTLTFVERNSFSNNRKSDIFLLNGNLEALSDLNDYSNGFDWNKQNISRHNDSRVRGVFVTDNVFNSPAIIKSLEAAYVNFHQNNYRNNVSFEFTDTPNTRLDGGDAFGSVTYKLRRTSPTPITYKLQPKSGSELSVMGGDRIELTGQHGFLPADNPNFVLSLTGKRSGEIVSSRNGELVIQSGILKFVPIFVESGEITVSTFLGDFENESSALVEIKSTDWNDVSISVEYSLCALFEINIDKRFVPFNAETVFYIPTQETFTLHDRLVGSQGRVIFDMRCIHE